MLRISDESHWRVREAIQNMEYACYLEDDYEQWEDIAASAFSDSLDDLDAEQFEMTVAAFEEYIIDKANDDLNVKNRANNKSIQAYLPDKSKFIKENIDETIFMFALFKCRKSDKGRN